MPNWCENALRVAGPRRAVEAFLEAAKEVTPEGKTMVLSFQSLYPTPQELLDTMAGFYGGGSEEQAAKQAALEAKQAENHARFGAKDWYGWRIQRWSCKWDVREDLEWELEGDEDHLEASVSFDTAWAPPENLFRHIAPSHPELTFRLEFAEPGCDFGGVLELKGEEELECWVGTYAESSLAVPMDEEDEAEEDDPSAPEVAVATTSEKSQQHGTIQ